MSDIPPEPPDSFISAISSEPRNTNPTRNRRSKGPNRNVERAATGELSNGTAASSQRWQRKPREYAVGPSEDLASGQSQVRHLDAHQPTDELTFKTREPTPGQSDRRRNRKPNEREGRSREGRTRGSAADQSLGDTLRNHGRPRKSKFGSQLSEQPNLGPSSSSLRHRSPPPHSDLTTRLTYALRTPPYPDCPICFGPLHPAQPTWSCSLSEETTSCCWASFHLKCVREWARKSTRETRDAFVARGEPREGEWRCPGCQTKRTQVPQRYFCFCSAVADPKPGLATPHSCGMSCTRKRASCEHPCPLSCHPGPCPPCVLTVHPPCHCARIVLSIRCDHVHSEPPPSLSCGQTCTRPLSCGNHVCQKDCHYGECDPCERKEIVKCFCGKDSKEVDCGEGMAKSQECRVVLPDGEGTIWNGRFDCGNICERSFTCGFHTCSRTCHPPSLITVPCPFDARSVTSCPCGKHLLRDLSTKPRTKCTDPIPTCSSPCGQHLDGCSHYCSAICHVGPCPPCTIPVTVPCRCGTTTRSTPCHERQRVIAQGKEVILCDKVCGALRLCGRHTCGRACCPLASMARGKSGKSKKGKLGIPQAIDTELEDAERLWHECDLVCGKMLGCGSHKCAEPDHRGPCPPCLRSSFDELICHCGRTVIYPPIPCGTRVHCTFPCDRPPPPCGHARTPHTCHEEPAQCPPCPFLTTKPCACGKANIGNVRCSQEKVACGQPCGRLLDCGFHRCQRNCHSDDCGACSSVCNKPRKFCLPAHHPCPLPCHAPSACNESEPCSVIIVASCPCGRFQQPTTCGRCTSNPSKTVSLLHCRDECMIAKRNARLAEALGISTEAKEKTNIVYPDDLFAFGKANASFVALVEKTLNEFVASDKKTHVLPYMRETRRKFVRGLCQVYRIDTQLVDQEPSIQLQRRIDTRIPSSLLSALIASQNPGTPNLGKLADLRTSTTRPAVALTRSNAPSSSIRGWTSVVSSTPQAGPPTSLNAWSSGTGTRTTVPAIPNRPSPTRTASAGMEDVRENWEED